MCMTMESDGKNDMFYKNPFSYEAYTCNIFISKNIAKNSSD